MPNRSDIIYTYDGSFVGFLCCVYESYYEKEIPLKILSPLINQIPLTPTKEIITDKHKAMKVYASIPKKMGSRGLYLIENGFLTNIQDKEIKLFHFMKLGFKEGFRFTNMIDNDYVYEITKAVRHLKREAHSFKGFIRFSVIDGVLVSKISPKNFVLPLISKHFCDRFQNEEFMIVDTTNNVALIYENKKSKLISICDFNFPKIDDEELFYKNLYKLFYETISIKQRHNPRLRASHMPKRYWENMTEFN